jgi:hypothetical protein
VVSECEKGVHSCGGGLRAVAFARWLFTMPPRTYAQYGDLSSSSSSDDEERGRRSRSPAARVRRSPGRGRRTNSARGTPVGPGSRSRSGSRSPLRSGSRSPLHAPREGEQRTQWLVRHVKEDLLEAMRHQRTDVVTIFTEFDRNGDGFLTRRELQLGLKRLGIHLSDVEMARLMEALDQNGDGAVDWREFIELVAPAADQRRFRPLRSQRRPANSGDGDDLSPGGRPIGRSGFPRRKHKMLDVLLKAHCCCEATWVLLTLVLGYNFWAAMLVSWNLFPVDGNCPVAAHCGSAASWFITLGVWQPMLTMLGAIGLLVARPNNCKRHYEKTAQQGQRGFSAVYWCGCVTGLIVVAAQLVVLVGGTSGLLTDLNNVVPTVTGTTTSAIDSSGSAATCAVSVNQGRSVEAVAAVPEPEPEAVGGEGRRRVQEIVTGMCGGNTDGRAEPDVSCPPPSMMRQDFYDILGRDTASCCACTRGIRDMPDGLCVDKDHPDPDLQNECTAVMRFASCGSTDADIEACIANPAGCLDCAQGPGESDGRYTRFAWMAERDSMRATSLCLSADRRFRCEFLFTRAQEAAPQCIDDRCAGNTAIDVNGIDVLGDVACEAPASLRPNAQSIVGRDALACCHITGMCVGNSDERAEPDVFCEAPGVLQPGAETIAGRDEATCCVTQGMCVGNSDRISEPDVVCASPSVLEDEADKIAGRDTQTCCHVTGMCIGNTDAGAEPDISCPGLGHIKPDASLISGRSYVDCCYVEGICVGNSDQISEPDVDCSAVDSRATLIPLATETEGRDYTSCCEITGYCEGNTNAEEDVLCELPATPVANAATTLAVAVAGGGSECCHVVGMCVGNSDPYAQPDVVCVAPSVLVEDAASVVGRGDECCVCHEQQSVEAACVPLDRAGTAAASPCTGVMTYAGCGDDATILACATGGGGGGADSSCSSCADETGSFVDFKARAAIAGAGRDIEQGVQGTAAAAVATGQLTAQELCMEADPYACHYEFDTVIQPCTPRAELQSSAVDTAPPPPPPSAPQSAAAAAPLLPVDPSAAASAPTVCTCEAEASSITRLMSSVSWDVGLSDSFIFFLFDLVLLSLLRGLGIYHIMNAPMGAVMLDRSDIL